MIRFVQRDSTTIPEYIICYSELVNTVRNVKLKKERKMSGWGGGGGGGMTGYESKGRGNFATWLFCAPSVARKWYISYIHKIRSFGEA